MGLLGGIFSYAVEAGVIEHNPTHGLRKPKYQVRDRRLSEAEYRVLGGILRDAQGSDRYRIHAEILRLIAMTGCRRGEIVNLKWSEIDLEGSCLRLIDRSEEHTSELQSLMRISYAVFCLKTKTHTITIKIEYKYV